MHDHHSHEGHEILEPNKLKALLEYMLGHNRHHAEELADAAHQLEHLDQAEAAAIIKESIELLNQGNDKLEAALKIIKE